MKIIKKIAIGTFLGVLLALMLVIGVTMYFLNKLVEILKFVIEKYQEFADDLACGFDDLAKWIAKVAENSLKN